MLTEQAANDLATPRVSQAARSYLVSKRLLDLVGALVGLAVLSPVLILLAVLIRSTSKGPALFRQTRIGRFGKPFTCYKFRTMYQDADDRTHRDFVKAYTEGQVVAQGAVGQPAAPFKLGRDPRITPLGHWLRRTSLDELPQLINVLKDEMSLVGPRPDVPYSVALYKDWHKLRLATQPGLTGLWQIRGRGRVAFEEGMRLDCEYVQRQCLRLDIEILLQTVPAVLSMRGAA
jgi:lipopolysaccharide/colanic/teichoic acid biosynthesis glycosyltransferase